MAWFAAMVLTLAGLVLLFQLYIYLQSRRLVGREAPHDSRMEAGNGPLLIYFYSPGCGPCRSMTPVIDALAAEHENVISVDVSRDRETAAKYRIRATPTTILVSDGKIEKVLLGAQSRDRLERLLAAG